MERLSSSGHSASYQVVYYIWQTLPVSPHFIQGAIGLLKVVQKTLSLSELIFKILP